LIYEGHQFPNAYQAGAFIAFHGSWNRAPFPQGGYNVVFRLRDKQDFAGFGVDAVGHEGGDGCGTGGFLTCAIRHMRKKYVKRPEDEREMQAALRAVEKKQLPHMLCVT
jgi:hypothetical protein